jgi:hypothetical protein
MTHNKEPIERVLTRAFLVLHILFVSFFAIPFKMARNIPQRNIPKFSSVHIFHGISSSDSNETSTASNYSVSDINGLHRISPSLFGLLVDHALESQA